MLSALVYLGGLLVLLGIAGLIRPLPRLRLAPRRRAAVLAGVGAALGLIGMLWPVSLVRVAVPTTTLDAAMPVYHFREYHERKVQAPPEKVWEAINTVRADEVTGFGALVGLRYLPAKLMGKPIPPAATGPLFEGMEAGGFLILSREPPRELVFAMLGQPWHLAGGPRAAQLRTPAEFEALNIPGIIKVAANMRVEDLGGGWSRLSTETRVLATDDHARRTFARYWRVIYPGSSFLRYAMLNAMARRATNPTPLPAK